MATKLRKGKKKQNPKSQIVNKTIQKVRLKLLDLSRRNNLLNFKESRRTIRIIDELPDQVFHQLIYDGKQLEFLPDETIEENNDIKKQDVLPFKNDSKINQKSSDVKSIKNNNTLSPEPFDQNIELPLPTKTPSSKHIDRFLQTLLFAQPLERRCKNLLRQWRTGIEEAGINYLFLALGFLEWYEANNSDLVNKAPLILVPLRIERTRLNSKNKCYSYVIAYSGEDIETNLSLAEKIRS